MFSHVMIGTNDLDKAKVFYDAVLGTIGFLCNSPDQAKAFHDAAVANGGKSIEDPPGQREGSKVYLAYIRDPDGNKLCALHRLP
jgi:catechol 2,3-dioxygenase-like lactoylglutathione lyase family enzyme